MCVWMENQNTCTEVSPVTPKIAVPLEGTGDCTREGSRESWVTGEVFLLALGVGYRAIAL